MKIRFALAGCLLALCASAAATSAGNIDWKQFRFGNAHLGVNKFETTISRTNVKFLGVSWLAQLGDLVDYSSPAVVKGVVYIASGDGVLWAYKADGCGRTLCKTPLWRSTSLSQIIDSPTVSNGIVYVGSQTNDNDASGKLNAFAASGCGQTTCSPLWQGNAGTKSILESSPAVANGTVFVGAFDGKLYAFAAGGCGQAQCQPNWTGSTGGSIESTPTVVNGIMYIGSDDGNLYAFAAGGCGGATCAPLWTGPIGSPVFSSTPAVSNGVVYIAGQHALAAFAATGCGNTSCSPLWTASDNNEFFNGSPAVWKGTVFIPWSTGLAAYAAGGCGQPSCQKLWTLFGTGAQAAVVSSPTVANGVVYAGRNTGEVLAWSAKPCGGGSCNEIWKGLLGDPIASSSPTVVNGTLYIGSADDTAPNPQGRLYVFTLQQ